MHIPPVGIEQGLEWGEVHGQMNACAGEVCEIRPPTARPWQDGRQSLPDWATGYRKSFMARAIWTGAISFGLVNVPVKLYSATSPKTVRFHQLSSKTGARIRQKRVDPSTGDEVPYEDIVKGYELSPDRYVLIEPEELEALDPKATKTIDIEEFVEESEIDPIYYDHSYYLAPTTGGPRPTPCFSRPCARPARWPSAGWSSAPSSSCAPYVPPRG